jgi:hydroxyacylglutathione hydrolase
MNLGYGASHVPNALSIWLDGVASFAGWFVPYDRPLLLVNESEDPTPAVRQLLRLGYDELAGTLAGGMLAWQTAGQESSSVQMLSVHQVCRILDAGEGLWILDVRSADELRDEGTITDAHHIHITQLAQHLDDVPVDQPVAIFCGSGLRSMIAASLLRKSGHRDVSVVLGGLAGWDSTACPVEL